MKNTTENALDVVIIGAGPVGLASAIEVKRQGLEALIFEKGVVVNSIFHFPTFMTFFTTADLLEIGAHPFPSTAQKPTRQMALGAQAPEICGSLAMIGRRFLIF